ncbi:MAG TPA: glycerophosphodiester phosphodiesterase family protein [bacterium]|nr:glycerophosphodiester phosphodiesterase family protein [bacterium]
MTDTARSGGGVRRGHRFWGARGVLGIAHRGASRYAPENTLAAIRLALDHGAPAVECDVQRTKDRHLVVIHDQTVDRTTDGRGPVAAHALEDLLRLDAGRWFGPAFAGERIPTLDEVLEVAGGRALLKLEIKNGPTFYEGIEQQMVEAIGRRGMEEDVLLISFDHESLRRVRALSPRIATGILYAARLVDGPGAARAAGADALCISWDYATGDVVSGGHGAGLGVFVWTVDDEDVARHCLSLGVDGITSNDTRLLGRLLGWR